jgi:endonuclease/exonuclease/phosphatase family metal-dependent hydrolase
MELSGNGSGASIHVMTYNIHRWAGRDGRLDIERLLSVIRAARADVVALNEVLHPVIMDGCTGTPLDELAERLGMAHVFGPSGWMDCAPAWYGPVGNALLSRYPLVDVTNTLLPKWPGTKQRSLLGASLASGPAQGMRTFVTHLDHAFEGTRLMQIHAALGEMTQDSPHYLAGDFNTHGFLGPNSRRLLPPVLRLMRRYGYQDAFHAVGKGPGRTFPADAPVFRIDFLFWPCRWAHGLRSARTINLDAVKHASDHRPVVVEWAWPEGPGLPAPC